jgi:tetratricopeptide (TPR) repeat protein
VLLSAAYLRSASDGRIAAKMLAARRDGHSVLAIRIGDVQVDEGLGARDTVSLANLDESSAAAAILDALDLPAPPAPADIGAGSRFPGTSPPVWNVPARNSCFTGRADLLERMRDHFSTDAAPAAAQALHGLGGVGKTQLAVEYAHRFRADYDLVWWINAAQEELVTAAMADIAPAIGLRRGENTDETAQAVREALRRGRPYERWLLVFDNAEDPESLSKHLPQGTGHVVVTSRNPGWSGVAVPVEVDAFSREESVEHLTRRVPGLAPGVAADVAVILGDLPLAIELAGAWLETTGMPAVDYVALLQTQLSAWLEENRLPDYPLPAAATWRVSIDRLREESPAAVRLLELCSCFAPEPISLRLLYGAEARQYLLPAVRSPQDPLGLAVVVRHLGRYALAKVDQARSTIEVHRLVQAVVRHSLSDTDLRTIEHDVHRILLTGRPKQGTTDDPENWPRYRDVWPHLGPSHASECADESVRGLLVERVRYMWLRGEFEDGIAFARRLEQFWESTRGPDDRQLLRLRFHVANILRSLGEHAAALDIDRDVLDRQTRVFGARDANTLMTRSAVGVDLGAVGDRAGALAMARSAYETFRDELHEDHPLTLRAATNLTLVLRFGGDCFQARDVDARTHQLRRRVLGEEHPMTLMSAANLGRDLREAGSFRESVELLRSTLEQYHRVLGPDFLATLRTATSLAVSLRKQGEHQEARRLTAATLEQYRLNYRPHHPDALACMLNLASDHAALGRNEEALAYADEAMAAYGRIRGGARQYPLICANNRVIYLTALGRRPEALDLARATTDALRTDLGDRHPYVLACAVNLANALAGAGRADEAAELDRSTHTSFEQQLGPSHPDTLYSAGNLAVSLRSLGAEDQAGQLMARSLAELERVLGPGHPHIRLVRTWRRISLDLEPQPV